MEPGKLCLVTGSCILTAGLNILGGKKKRGDTEMPVYRMDPPLSLLEETDQVVESH